MWAGGDPGCLRDAFDHRRQRAGCRDRLAPWAAVRTRQGKAAELGRRRRNDGLAAVFSPDLARVGRFLGDLPLRWSGCRVLIVGHRLTAEPGIRKEQRVEVVGI
jgi:hypothetical protein